MASFVEISVYKSIYLILIFAFRCVIAFDVLPLPAKSSYVDTESVTNIAFHTGNDDDRLFRLSIECDATPSNSLMVTFGCDVNTNGVIDHDELDAMVGWDAGCWMYRDRRSGKSDFVAIHSIRSRLDWRVELDGNREVLSISAVDSYGKVFPNSIPRTMFDTSWNIMSIVRRGYGESKGNIISEISNFGFSVIIR